MGFPLRAGFVCFVVAAMGLAVGGGCASKPAAPETEAKPEAATSESATQGATQASHVPSAAAGSTAATEAEASARASGATGRAAAGEMPQGPGAAEPATHAGAQAAGTATADGARVAGTGAAGRGGGASADGSSSSPTGSALPVARAAQTSDERREAIDKRLNDSLGSFDAKLRTEQQKIAQERDARQTTVAAAATTDGAGEPTGGEPRAEAAGSAATDDADKPAASHGGPNSRRGESRSTRAGDLKSDKTAGGANGNAAGNGAVANEIPDGNDDDIVARRLRKAAEQETDPELKDKLWEEYVEYKKNNQGK